MPTSNAVPSYDPSDLIFNAEKLDEVVNSTSLTYTDRIGVTRMTTAGYQAEMAYDVAAVENSKNTAINTTIPGKVAEVDAAKTIAVASSIPAKVAEVETAKNTAIDVSIPNAVAVVLASGGYAVPVLYAAGISLTQPTQTVEYAGIVYAPKVESLPFTTSGTFETAKFRLIQGVASADLESAIGTQLVGHQPARPGAASTTAKAELDNLAGNFFSTAASESPTYGPELMDGTGWTLGANWSGTFATGFTHATGNVAPLTKSYSFIPGAVYEVALTVNSPSSSETSNSGWTVSLNGSVGFEIYEGNFTSHTYRRGIVAPSGTDLVIKPEATFDGTIAAISVRQVIGFPQHVTELTDSSGQATFEIKPLVKALGSVFLGRNNARQNTTGHQNVAVGVEALRDNTSGFWNSAIGTLALSKNTVGSRNIGIGYVALAENISGHRNVGIGTFALRENTHGHNNIAIGADCMSGMHTGYANIALGLAALGISPTGRENIAIGVSALGSLGDSHNHVAIGDYAAAFLVGASATRATFAIGHDAARQSTAAPNFAAGQYALRENVTGDRNIAIGNEALRYPTTSNQNLVIGMDACPGTAGSTLTRNLVIGHGAGIAMTTGANYNVLIGYATGNNYTTANNNILIGYNVQGQTPTETYRLNIGNLLYGKLSAALGCIGIDVTDPTARLHLPAGEAGSHRAPLKFSVGTLQTTPENGTFEFDGEKLYTTIQGVRRPFASVGGVSHRAAGDGGTVTQAVGKNNQVTLNRVTGKIKLNNSALAANTSVQFNFINSYLTADDILTMTMDASSVADPSSYNVWAAVGAGSAKITIRNISGGSLSEAVAINFAIIKGATS